MLIITTAQIRHSNLSLNVHNTRQTTTRHKLSDRSETSNNELKQHRHEVKRRSENKTEFHRITYSQEDIQVEYTHHAA